MTFLEICQRTRELAGIAGTGPSTTIGQSGELLRLVHWVQSSWIDIQNLHKSWNFLLNDLSFETTAGKGDYTLANIGAPNLRLLDSSSLRCQQTSMGYVNRQYMEAWDWHQFRDTYRFNNLVQARPIRFAVDPKDKSLSLASIPDAGGYTITGRYWSKPVALTLDADVPSMPDEFHDLIMYMALSKYAGYEAASEVKSEALENKSRLLAALEADQLPDMYLEGSL